MSGRRWVASVVVAVSGALVPIAGATEAAAMAPALPATTVITGDACPTAVPAGTLSDGSAAIGAKKLCDRAVAAARSPQARTAIRAAFHMLGAPYACGDVGRSAAFRFDCSSLVSRAYAVAGIPSAGTTWSPSTRDLVPWDGRKLASWVRYVAPSKVLPGDLVLYSTGASLSRHVVMYLGSGYMLHTNYCGGVAHVERFYGFPHSGSHVFLVARRVVVPNSSAPKPVDLSRSTAARATTVSFAKLIAHDRATTIRVQKALNDVVTVGLLVDGRWDGGLFAAIVGFRRFGMNMSDNITAPIDRATIRALGKKAGFTLVA